MEIARERHTIVRMECGVGSFVMENTPLASFVGIEGPDVIDADAVRRVNAAYTLDRQRTVDQDPRYGIRQLVDVALKGLSPGINDVTTAVMCVDYLTAVLVRLKDRQLEPPSRSESGEVRVLCCRATYADFVADTFDQIRQNAEGNVAMLQRLLESLATLGDVTTSRSRRRALLRQAEAITEVIARTVASPVDRGALESYATRVSQALNVGL